MGIMDVNGLKVQLSTNQLLSPLSHKYHLLGAQRTEKNKEIILSMSETKLTKEYCK